jgi:hypothetical protein
MMMMIRFKGGRRWYQSCGCAIVFRVQVEFAHVVGKMMLTARKEEMGFPGNQRMSRLSRDEE